MLDESEDIETWFSSSFYSVQYYLLFYWCAITIWHFLQCSFLITGIPAFLLINATDLDFPGRINRLELVNLHGNVLVEIPVQYHASRPSLYNVSNILPPEGFFYLKVGIWFHLCAYLCIYIYLYQAEFCKPIIYLFNNNCNNKRWANPLEDAPIVFALYSMFLLRT